MLKNNKQEEKRAPKIMFNSMNCFWQEKSLGALATFKSGNTPSKSIDSYWNGDIPWISASSMHTDALFDSDYHISKEAVLNGAKMARPNSLLLLVRGSMLFNRVPLGKAVTEVAFNQDVKAINSISEVSNDFLFYWLKSKEHFLLHMVTGTGIGAGKLDTDALKGLSVFYPDTQQQQAIVEFLSAVDKKISLLKEKHALLEQYKKGVMQKLFKQKIRFKDDSGNEFPDWQSRRFEEVFVRITRKNKEDNQNVLTISAQMGLVNQEKYFNKSVSAKDLTGYYLLESGDFAYNKSYSKGYPMGAIKRLNNYDKGVVSTLYICFRVVGEQEPLFWEQFFEAGQLNREINKIAQEGARNHGLLNVSVTEFFSDIEVPVPSRAEQRKIADFLRALDQKLDAVKEQVELTQTFKKGLLQQMFV
ncbi:restriction endonuclease subunit S [Alteromonas sp. 009811495]|uniref:restriction endonuclease subunit S n=1 Tax=Alteromonas sp. 009811495 TaxID=3002962 RepID=UPI00237E5090|nr:restriction endonuclease subunit S [Alteromonas sp. 009811495]WDT85356.1 restriction endonuclease subunit S [Alteromonas sp. 009811495]